MTTIKASCPADGEVELTTADIALRVCRQRQALSRYEFICPLCSEMVQKPADEHIQSLLMSGGVQPEPLDIPAEALEDKHGPALSYDDLLDFHLALERTSLLAAEAGRKAGC